jgi:hypothetical protein
LYFKFTTHRYASLRQYFEQFAAFKFINAPPDPLQHREWQEELDQIGAMINSSKREKNIEILARTADFARYGRREEGKKRREKRREKRKEREREKREERREEKRREKREERREKRRRRRKEEEK